MSYIEDERIRAISLREELFRDPGGGLYKGIPRDNVLLKPELNLNSFIRDDAIN